MATFRLISADQARALVAARRPEPSAEYREYVRALDDATAGRIELVDGDRPRAIRARLRAAALAEGRAIAIQPRENALVFWLVDPGRPT